MIINKILIYGSTPLTERVVDLISHHYDLVGYIPSESPFIERNINLPIVNEDIEHDIKLSLQYNKKINNIDNAFNVHTGLLPEWGGMNVLYNTLKEDAREQGLTFHKMGSNFDFGEIISKTTYPVVEGDDMVSLYKRMLDQSPYFVLNSLKLLESLSLKDISLCCKHPPRIFKRSQVEEEDLDMFLEQGKQLKNIFSCSNG